MSDVRLDGVSKRYGSSVAVERMDLAIDHGEFIALLGPSGCGKTTTLRMIAGFVEPSEGRIRIGERDVTRLPAHRRETGMVFQSYALFTHMTVAENVAFGLEMRRIPRDERETKTREALDLVRLGGFLDRYPRELSGGQQQRVALARALVINPSVLLLDEPLSNLDAKLRTEVRVEIRALQQRLGLTTLMVTHDQEEALTMADRLAVMNKGRVCQVGTAQQIYERPTTSFVAGFVGRCNLIDGALVAPGMFATRTGAQFPCAPDQAIAAGVPHQLAIRADRIAIAVGPSASDGLAARLVRSAYLGAQTEYQVEVGGIELGAIRPTPDENDPLQGIAPGTPLSVTWNPSDARLVARGE